MKVLIAYDGSNDSDAALDDLVRAGLPPAGEALVVSVADVWLPPPNGSRSPDDGPDQILDPAAEQWLQQQWDRGRAKVAEAESLAGHARKRVQKALPAWNVRSEATYGSPAWEIIAKADEMDADLIVVGSQGRSAIGRFVLGSISQKVLTEARCSVRIGRGKIEVDETPVRSLVGFDGSNGSIAALNAAASRCWPPGSEVRVISAAEEILPSAIGRFIPPVTSAAAAINAAERNWLGNQAKQALAAIGPTTVPFSFETISGHPKEVLIAEASRWNADCIFLGANKFGSRIERFLLGSTSAAVAARATASVEVVRSKSE
ncbi:MAG: universal stress protein [Acidobacteria bacterium]|nr:universal stress protein [Acidobacteriota bacterium]